MRSWEPHLGAVLELGDVLGHRAVCFLLGGLDDLRVGHHGAQCGRLGPRGAALEASCSVLGRMECSPCPQSICASLVAGGSSKRNEMW